jgi:hypothetical protein
LALKEPYVSIPQETHGRGYIYFGSERAICEYPTGNAW